MCFYTYFMFFLCYDHKTTKLQNNSGWKKQPLEIISSKLLLKKKKKKVLVSCGKETKTGYSTPDVMPGAKERGQITSSELLATLFLMQPRVLWAFPATSRHCWLLLKLLITRTPISLLS